MLTEVETRMLDLEDHVMIDYVETDEDTEDNGFPSVKVVKNMRTYLKLALVGIELEAWEDIDLLNFWVKDNDTGMIKVSFSMEAKQLDTFIEQLQYFRSKMTSEEDNKDEYNNNPPATINNVMY